jgi:hypothetical protein
MKWTAFNWMMSSSALSIDELLTSGMGKRFEPRPGMVMKEWLVPADERVDWIQLAKKPAIS